MDAYNDVLGSAANFRRHSARAGPRRGHESSRELACRRSPVHQHDAGQPHATVGLRRRLLARILSGEATDFTWLPLGVMHDLVFEVDAYGRRTTGAKACADPRVFVVVLHTASAPARGRSADSTGLPRSVRSRSELRRAACRRPAAPAARGTTRPREGQSWRTGLRIVTLPADSVAAALGAKPGDVVLRAAGRPVTGADMLTRLIQRLTNTGTTDVIVWRNQASRRLTYRLR